MFLTAQILVKNNELTIERCLNSILHLNCKILIGDLGCRDRTIDICNSYNCEVTRISLNDNFSLARNHLKGLTKTQWNFFIEPWEQLLYGDEEILNLKSKERAAFKVNCVQGDLITKQTRIWHSGHETNFINPVFETIKGDANQTGIYFSVGVHNNQKLYLELTEKWKKASPLSAETLYYLSCCHLSAKNWDAFINYANLFLYQTKEQSMAFVMTNYYCSMVNCYIKKNYQESIRFLMPCLAIKPTMAEFWCLMADIFYATKQYKKASSFYENALILGSKRLAIDDYPMEISKYKEYPQKMIESCEKIKDSTKLYSG
jgi:tetratricopeptide (TPR) repeat protein